MTLTELRYVVAVARERHFGRAAASCFVSQPTLSVAIRKLEDELGVSLFERRKHDVQLTAVGDRIVSQAQRVLEESDLIRMIAEAGSDPLKGTFKLGAIYTVGPYLLPGLVQTLTQLAPLMPLNIEENFTARLSERLKQGELDAIIIALPFEEPGIEVTPLYREPFVCVLPASHPLQEKETLDADDLLDEPLLLLGEGHCLRTQVVAFCPQCLTQESRALEGSSIETIRHMVASGNGITVLPCTAAGVDRYAQRLLTIRRFSPPAPSRTVALAWRNSFPRPAAIEAVAEACHSSQLSCVELINRNKLS